MGAGSYHSDVRTARSSIGTTRESTQAFDYHSSATTGKVNSVHPDLNIFGKVREACDSKEHPDSTPIAVCMDVTSSRGRDARAIYEQVPAFLGAIQVGSIVPDPQILWAAFGDATHDKAPLQIGQFESDRRIDENLKRIWMEEGGGGTGEESHELVAWYLANKTKLDANKRGKKGFAFYTSDEAPYPTVSRAFVKTHIGDSLPADVPTVDVFKALQLKYHTFLIFPRATMEERKAAIDSEIRQRLQLAGGRFDKVSIRASLIWDNRNDLDLHCLTPAGEHIYFGTMKSRCGGELDVDRNRSGETNKPVENIRWAQGTAREGRYRFYVENFRYWESSQAEIPFRAELDVNGEIQHFEGKTKRGATGSESRVELFDFVYKADSKAETDNRAAYTDAVVLEKWGRYIPACNILRVKDPASSVEVMLGAMALQNGTLTLEQFVANMKQRKVAADRRADVEEALKSFANQGVFHEVDKDLFE